MQVRYFETEGFARAFARTLRGAHGIQITCVGWGRFCLTYRVNSTR